MEAKNTLKAVKFTSVPEMLTDPVFRENLRKEIAHFYRGIPSYNIKRHPYHRLREMGCWDLDGLIKVYTEYYITKSVHHPTSVREFVTGMLSRAARKTILYYAKQEQEVKNTVE